MNLDESSFDAKDAEAKANELVSFVSALEMGSFYGQDIERWVEKPQHPRICSLATPDYVFARWAKEERQEYFRKLCAGRDQVIALIIELLRYQKWSVALEKKGP
jgi:hypothetical protein